MWGGIRYKGYLSGVLIITPNLIGLKVGQLLFYNKFKL